MRISYINLYGLGEQSEQILDKQTPIFRDHFGFYTNKPSHLRL